MSGWLIALIALVVIGAGIGIFFAIRRHNYIKELRERGWQLDPSPSPAVANGLLVPPFGVGFGRETDEHVTGRTRVSGVFFQVFEYDGANDARIVCMPLGIPLPQLVAATVGQSRQGVNLPHRTMLNTGGVLLAESPEFAQAFMQIAGGAIEGFAQRYQVNLAVDGDQLTQVGAPKDPEELEAYLEALAPISAAVQAATGQLEPFRQPPPQMRLGFYGRPSWYYLPTDDGLLNIVEHTRGGLNHRTTDVVHGEFFPGAFFVAFMHHWQTQRTVTSTDANGNTTTRTVTDNHSEAIHEITLPFAMPDLTITDDSKLRRLFSGPSLDFELGAFNERFDVYSSVPKFAYDVLHPRQLEYLMSAPLPFRGAGNKLRPTALEHSQNAIGYELEVLAGFFARVPNFVWHDLGVPQPPLRLRPDGTIEMLTV